MKVNIIKENIKYQLYIQMKIINKEEELLNLEILNKMM